MTVFASRALLREYLEDMAIVSISSLIRQAYIESDGIGGKMVETIRREVANIRGEARSLAWDKYLDLLVPRCIKEAYEYVDMKARLLEPASKRQRSYTSTPRRRS